MLGLRQLDWSEVQYLTCPCEMLWNVGFLKFIYSLTSWRLYLVSKCAPSSISSWTRLEAKGFKWSVPKYLNGLKLNKQWLMTKLMQILRMNKLVQKRRICCTRISGHNILDTWVCDDFCEVVGRWIQIDGPVLACQVVRSVSFWVFCSPSISMGVAAKSCWSFVIFPSHSWQWVLNVMVCTHIVTHNQTRNSI